MALEGTFQDMSLLDLFQIFAMGHKSGVLLVRQSTRCGVIYVLDGQGRDALIVQQPNNTITASGEQAVVCMLGWQTANFTFRHDLAVNHRPTRIVHDWGWLEQAASRQHSAIPIAPEPEAAPRKPGSFSPIPSAQSLVSAATRSGLPTATMSTLSPDVALHLMPRSPTSARTIKFNVDEWRVLSWIAQGASVRQIAQATGCELALIMGIVNDLYLDGLVTMLPHTTSNPVQSVAKTSATMPRPAPLTTAIVPERRIVEAVMRRIRGS